MFEAMKHSWITATAVMLPAFAGLTYAADTNDFRLVDAAKNQDQPSLRVLLDQKVDVNARSSDGSTALLWLAHWNDLDSANLLLARSPCSYAFLNLNRNA